MLAPCINGRWVDVKSGDSEKQLFLSRRVVTESAEFDGGVLVDEKGKIEGVFTRNAVDTFLTSKTSNVKVINQYFTYLQ